MSDTTPLTAIARLKAAERADQSLLTDISQALGLKPGERQSDRWKQKLREELVREHIAAEKKKKAPIKASLRRFFKQG